MIYKIQTRINIANNYIYFGISTFSENKTSAILAAKESSLPRMY